jgi:tyrosinase
MSLSTTEQQAFVQAVLNLKKGATDRYQPYTDTHVTYFGSVSGVRWAHQAPSFLPWHRRFLLDFERDLQQISGNASMGLPYWDWSQTRDTTRYPFSDTFLGGNGDPNSGSQGNAVITGPFQLGQWSVNDPSGSGFTYLARNFGAFAASLPASSEVAQVLGITPYDAASWNGSPTGSFRNQLEGFRGPNLHNRVHNFIGGTMPTAASPNDPVFFLHHCFIDKLWVDWQAANPSEPKYLPNGNGTSDVVDLNQAMQPWTDAPNTPVSLLDHTHWYSYDTDAPKPLKALVGQGARN